MFSFIPYLLVLGMISFPNALLLLPERIKWFKEYNRQLKENSKKDQTEEIAIDF